jgi:outer membrane protein OmpA-like peptidoglycan-associated protein
MTSSLSALRATLPALVALGLASLVACGAAAVPQELMDARAAYADAAKGPAAELAPAQLDTAKTSLDVAQKSFDSDGPSQKTKDLAYVAERRAEIAAAEGGREKAERKRASLDKDFKTTQMEGLEKTKEGLAQTKEQLEAEKRAREAANQDVNKTKAELAAEKAARAEAEKRAAAALASLQEIAKVKEEARGVVITLSGSVLFATGKSDLLPIAKEKLDQVAKALVSQGFKAIVVQGYTDSRGSAADNQTLSLKRAQSVRDYLTTQQIPPEKITAEGQGASKPVASNDTADGRAENRRVEIVVTPDKG